MAAHGYDPQYRKIAWKLDKISSKASLLMLNVVKINKELKEAKKELMNLIKVNK